MKRAFISLLVFCLTVSLCACGNEPKSFKDEESTSTEESHVTESKIDMALVGKWNGGDLLYEFHEDGTGVVDNHNKTTEFTWKSANGALILTFHENGQENVVTYPRYQADAVGLIFWDAIGSAHSFVSENEFNAVMTVGNIDIEQSVVFDNKAELLPGESVTKEVTVTNKGKNSAYIRTLIAIEDTFDVGGDIRVFYNCNCTDGDNCQAWIQPDENNDWLQILVADEDGKWVEVDGSTWTVYTVGYFNYEAAGLENSILLPGESVKSLNRIALRVDVSNDFYVRAGEKYDIHVFTQAVQADGFTTAEEAFEAAYDVGKITHDIDEEVAQWFAELLDVEVRVFDYSMYENVDFPIWEDVNGTVTN